MGADRKETIALLVLAFLVLTGAGFRLWMRESDIIIEVLEPESPGSAPAAAGRFEYPSSTPAAAAGPQGMADEHQPSGTGGRVDVNTASASELELLPGIGPALARRIIQDRQQNGPYRRYEDLARVRGIGEKLVKQLRPFVILR